MSRSEWEKGEWTLSCVEYRKFRDALIRGFNDLQDNRYAQSLQLKADFERITKNKEEFKRILGTCLCNLPVSDPAAAHTLFYKLCENRKMEADIVRRAMFMDKKEVVMGSTTIPNLGPDRTISVEAWVAEKNRTCYSGMGRRVDAEGKIWANQWTERKHPKTPKKKDFPKANKATTHFHVGSEADIFLKAEDRRVTWVVHENNHAIEFANAEPMAEVFWRALRAVNWTRGTGGRTWGSDEYADDAEREGGYSSDKTKGRWGNQQEEWEKKSRPLAPRMLLLGPSRRF